MKLFDILSCFSVATAAMTRCTTICHLLECASPVTAGCKASGTTYPHSFPAARRANAWLETASSDAVQGLGECCKGNVM